MRVSEAAVGSETERDSTGRLKQEIVTYALNVEQREMIARLESKSDDQLKKIIKDDSFFGSTDTEKNIARKILRNRGY